MTCKEENIVNISMIAAQLLIDGRIEQDNISGHAGLTEAIIELAESFEIENTGVDYNTGDRDYWEEIDEFAERELIDRYGTDHVPETQPAEVKVIIDGGITEAVLTDRSVPLNVEIISIDKDYEDYEQLKDYRDKIYADDRFMPCDYSTAYFEVTENSSPTVPCKDSLDSIINSAENRRVNQSATQSVQKDIELQ